jgi:outer membrane protein assembly factor BamB
VYAFDRTRLGAGAVWQYRVSASGSSPDLGESTISSPAYSNGLVFVAGGATTNGQPGKIAALDAATGAERWAIYPDGFVLPGLTLSGEVLFAAVSNAQTFKGQLLVVAQATGETAYVWPTPTEIWGQPTYANGTLYVGDVGTGLWALSPAGLSHP